tara:strand:- start:417 stop:1157 length:741 start_codon:yes stop_codon:yes gene_type:complete
MLKRPAHRFHPPTTPSVNRPTSGVLANIIQGFKTEPTRPHKHEKFAIQASSVYARLLERNYEYYGVPFKSPDIIELQPPKKRAVQDEPELDFVDKVYLKFNILKSGKVRVKLIPHFLELWNNYYSKGKKPPIKMVIAAYKAIGFSNEFLQKIVTNQKKRIEFAKKLEKIIEKIFDKSTTTKRKPVKAKVEEKVEEVETTDVPPDDDDDDDDDDDGPEEDEGILPEEEEEDAEEENVEDVCVDDFDE